MEINQGFFIAIDAELGALAVLLEKKHPGLKWVQSALSLSAIGPVKGEEQGVILNAMVSPQMLQQLYNSSSAGLPKGSALQSVYITLKQTMAHALNSEGTPEEAVSVPAGVDEEEEGSGAVELVTEGLLSIWGAALDYSGHSHTAVQRFFKHANPWAHTPVPMLGADRLYLHPVCGTSSGSRYFLVAFGTSFGMAIRVAGTFPSTTLSVRMEGWSSPETPVYLKGIGTFGSGYEGKIVNTNGDSAYASIHVIVRDWTEIMALVGSIYAVCSMSEKMSPLCPVDWMKEIYHANN